MISVSTCPQNSSNISLMCSSTSWEVCVTGGRFHGLLTVPFPRWVPCGVLLFPRPCCWFNYNKTSLEYQSKCSYPLVWERGCMYDGAFHGNTKKTLTMILTIFCRWFMSALVWFFIDLSSLVTSPSAPWRRFSCFIKYFIAATNVFNMRKFTLRISLGWKMRKKLLKIKKNGTIRSIPFEDASLWHS